MVLNIASNEMDQSDLMHRQILRYVTLACSVFCEYLVSGNPRVKNAAFTAMRLIISHGLKPRFFHVEKPSHAKTQSEKMVELLNFDALTLSEEVQKTRSN